MKEYWLGKHFFRIFGVNHGFPFDYPLWFVRDLILITVLTPVIYLFCKYLRGYGVFAVLICRHIGLFQVFGIGDCFYLIGAWLSISGRGLVVSLSHFKWPALLSSFLILFFLPETYQHNPELYSVLSGVFVVAGCICAISFSARGIQQGLLHANPFLAKSSFFIFSAHAILILDDFARFIMLHVTSVRGDLYWCMDLVFRPLIAIGICLGLFYGLNRWFPSVSRVLIGGR